jgi:hypothetical protein
VRFYHGTHTDAADAFEAGGRLDPIVAAGLHIDGEDGFYLADDRGDAEFFALRRWSGRVVAYDVSPYAVDQLLARGARRTPIPGGCPPYFQGNEFFIPVAVFPLFNDLLKSGEINVV